MAEKVDRADGKVLSRKEDILRYLDFSETLFTKWLERGMPVLFKDGRFYAHKDNLDEFFRRVTLRRGS